MPVLVLVLVAFVPRGLRDVGGADEGECETRLRPPSSPSRAPDPATATARSATPHTPGAHHWERPGDLKHGNARRDVDEPLG